MKVVCRKCGKQAINPWNGKLTDICYECEKEDKKKSTLNVSPPKAAIKFSWYKLAAGALLGFIIAAALEDSNETPRIFSNSQVCKAAIAITMAKPVDIIKYHRTESNNEHFLSYNYEGSNWTYRCKIEGNRAIWASPSGRWRTHDYDGIIQFYENEDILTVIETYNDGSNRMKKYHISQLSQHP